MVEYHKYNISFSLTTEIDNSQKLKGMIEEALLKDVVMDTEHMENLEVKHQD